MNQAREFVHKWGKDKVNTFTKYPSILTLHKIGERGILQPELTTDLPSDNLHVTEKIDGTSVRIIAFPDMSYLIGSREQIIHCSGDLYYGTDLGIVDSLKSLDLLNGFNMTPNTQLLTIYGELYGGNIGSNNKNYGKDKIGFRVFDAVYHTLPYLIQSVLNNKDLSIISRWREQESSSGIRYGQPFLPKHELNELCKLLGLEFVPELPMRSISDTSIEGIHEWLKTHLSTTLASLSETALNTPEGLVISTDDRSKIVKIRFEDYQRTEKANRK